MERMERRENVYVGHFTINIIFIFIFIEDLLLVILNLKINTYACQFCKNNFRQSLALFWERGSHLQ